MSQLPIDLIPIIVLRSQSLEDGLCDAFDLPLTFRAQALVMLLWIRSEPVSSSVAIPFRGSCSTPVELTPTFPEMIGSMTCSLRAVSKEPDYSIIIPIDPLPVTSVAGIDSRNAL
ncbi:hypothetical protein C492_09540 [Natronococcus jeotgali DSM 18795]|uniref:Uncharacterized protein n=1 Tax=Natronococcus jeotgali DSM 18795 TaxID=1227498 RepID=L9XKV2_9EURY|nr:hypothetical protein C492_09540 [Natronococcus jeotgali DSM 18795]